MDYLGCWKISVRSYLGICHFSYHPPSWPCKHPSESRSASKPGPWLLLKRISTMCCAPRENRLVTWQCHLRVAKSCLKTMRSSFACQQDLQGGQNTFKAVARKSPWSLYPSIWIHSGVASFTQEGTGFSLSASLPWFSHNEPYGGGKKKKKEDLLCCIREGKNPQFLAFAK